MHVETILVLGAVVLVVGALAVAGALVFGVPGLGLAPSGLHFGHRAKRVAAASGIAVLLVGVGVAATVNHGHAGEAVLHAALGPTTSGSHVSSSDPSTARTTRSTRTTRSSSHGSHGSATTGAAASTTTGRGRSSSTTTGGKVKAQGHTPTRPTTPTTVTRSRHRRGTTTTTRPRTPPTTRPRTTTTTQAPPPPPPPPTTTEAPTTTQPETTTTAPPPLVGDLNHDGMVGCIDLGILESELGQLGSLPGDLNHDGIVDTSDLNLLNANWTGDGTICL